MLARPDAADAELDVRHGEPRELADDRPMAQHLPFATGQQLFLETGTPDGTLCRFVVKGPRRDWRGTASVFSPAFGNLAAVEAR